jgi:uncharacterized membrane protein YfcA
MLVQGTGVSRHFHVAALALAVIATVLAVQTGSHVELLSLDEYLGDAFPPRWAVITIVIFLAAVVSSTVGFAFSAISGAMILHYVPNGVEAVQIMMIASIGVQAYSVAGLARSIQWSRCAPFLLGGMATLPLGILLLVSLEPRTYVLAIGVALAAYGLYMLVRRTAVVRAGSRPAADAVAGALGGITGPLAAFPGAFVTIWCGMRGWDKTVQRAVYQPYILVMQLIGFGALCLLQRQSVPDPALLAYALPGFAGAIIGLRVFHGLTDPQFQRMINLALIASGVALVLK